MCVRFATALTLGLLVIGLVAKHAAADPPEKLLKQRAEIALKTFKSQWRHFLGGQATVETVYQWSRRTCDAEQAMAPNKAVRMTALKNHLHRMSELRRAALAFAKAGQRPDHDADAAQFFVLEAEIWIDQAKAKAKK